MRDVVKSANEPARPSSQETTGHEWDGIREYNNPLPRWWLYVLYATIVWSIGYWVLYPSWPLATDYTRGLFGYSSRETLTQEIAVAQADRSRRGDRIRTATWEEIKADPDLLKLALAEVLGQRP